MNENSWRRSFTAKRYIHPPFAESIVTMWPSCMLVIGEVYGIGESQPASAALRLLHGDDDVYERKDVQYSVRKDGIPIHMIKHKSNGYNLTMESFCDIQRVPVAYTKIVFCNDGNKSINEIISLSLRTGNENDLTGSDDDGYKPYIADLSKWNCVPQTWKSDGNHIMTDGTYSIFIYYDLDIRPVWQDKLKFKLHLLPGESREIILSFGRSAAKEFDYDNIMNDVINKSDSQCLISYPQGSRGAGKEGRELL